MSQFTELIDQYFAGWNETDVVRRRDLITRTWTDDATYLDPLMESAGHAGIDAMIAGVQQQFADHRFRRTSAIDRHQDRLRFSWELVSISGGPAIATATDCGVVAADGRLQSVTGFLDTMPAAKPDQ